jgi:hypothetical protein
MTTGLQIALAGGALVGLGVALLLWRLVPMRPDAADVVKRYSPQGVRDREATTRAALSTTSATERLGVWALRTVPAAWWGRTPTRELALLQIPLHRHYGSKILYAFVGLLIPPIGAYVLAAVWITLPIAVPAAGSLVAAAVLFWLPDFNARDDARKARSEFNRALGAYIDLVALERLGGSGSREAMELAAKVGDNWVFRRIGEELARSRWSGIAPWDALHTLADELGLYDQLRARSEAVRAAMLANELAKANAAGERMTLPMALLSVVFLVILVVPALLQLTGGA